MTETMAVTEGAPPEAEPEQRVTALELFFDLVFVFAITQVTGFIAADPEWMRLLQGMAILIVIWWAWASFAWLGNTAGTDEGLFRVTLFAAAGGMLIVAIAMPRAFGQDALAFGIAYAIVRALHIGAYAILGRDDPQLALVVRRLARSMLPVALLLVLAGLVDGPVRTACWILAIVIEIGGLFVFGVDGWRVDAGHMAERHGLIVIIALGESIVALGAGAEGHALDVGTIVAVVLGLTVAFAMWWAYFDVVALVAARRFQRAVGAERARIARDSYTFLHAPMIAGIILFALGAKKTLVHVDDALEAVPAVGLCGGVAMYLLAHVAFRLRNVHSLNTARLAVAVVLLALIPVATVIPALLAMAIVAALMVALLSYEFIRFHEARERLRHALAP
ncbi:low temperature requirement protein A [Baekduia sp.]|jgi:low temperature requirement protein LtrA|uniref:low temperature requirement protein A n=1 Tax=Baekduia sp. TaxID=2600305 RepID=UPI002DFB13CB|nr:low temperature requirement protein A [Baekduia sp.]